MNLLKMIDVVSTIDKHEELKLTNEEKLLLIRLRMISCVDHVPSVGQKHHACGKFEHNELYMSGQFDWLRNDIDEYKIHLMPSDNSIEIFGKHYYLLLRVKMI